MRSGELFSTSRPVIFNAMTDLTRILSAIEQGDPRATEQLLPLVYDELRKLAAAKMAQDAPDIRCKPPPWCRKPICALWRAGMRQHPVRGCVSTPCGDASAPRERNWNSRGHFFAAAAEAMRRILIDNARRKQTQKRGGNVVRQPLEDGAKPPQG